MTSEELSSSAETRHKKGKPYRTSSLNGLWLLYIFLFVLIYLILHPRGKEEVIVTDSAINDAYARGECKKLLEHQSETIKTLISKANRIYPSLYVINDGEVLDESSVYRVPLPICVIALIPQIPSHVFSELEHTPYGPDSVHVGLQSHEHKINPPTMRHVNYKFSKAFEVYYADVDIQESGLYELDAKLEWRNWQWQFSFIYNNTHALYSTGLSIELSAEIAPYRYLDQAFFNTDITPRFIRTKGSNGQRKARCFTKKSNYTSPSAGSWKKVPTGGDEWGYKWEPDFCTLDEFTPAELFECLADKRIHAYGSGEIRRLVKSLVNGNDWCSDPNGKCQCDDAELSEPQNLTTIKGGTKTIHVVNTTVFEAFRKPIEFGKNSAVHFQQINNLRSESLIWLREFYADEVARAILDGSLSIIHSMTSSLRSVEPADAVIFDVAVPKSNPFLGGDELYENSLGEWVISLMHFKKAIKEAYKDTPVYLRLLTPFCCKNSDTFFERKSGPRVQLFNDLLKTVFDINNSGVDKTGNIMIFDPSNMGGRAETLTHYGSCSHNYPRASHTRMEAQIFANMMCYRRRNGQVSLKTKSQW